MFEKLIPIAAKYEDIEFRLSLPETAAMGMSFSNMMGSFGERK